MSILIMVARRSRFMMSIKADIVDTFRGAGLLEPITGDEETF